jgi:hypothetical protein
MSVQATCWVWAHSESKNGTRMVALAIADAANAGGAESCQAVGTIARMTRLGESTVHEAINWLLDHGELVCDGPNPRYKNARIYHFPALVRGVRILDPQESEGSGMLPLGVQISGERGPDSGPDPKLQTPSKTPLPSGEPEGWVEWWKRYPRKADKGHALKAYLKALDLTTPDVLLAALNRQRPALMKKDPRYCPYPATWLNGCHWENDEKPETKNQSNLANGGFL